jgi:mono/diheme cytochrome c family protein
VRRAALFTAGAAAACAAFAADASEPAIDYTLYCQGCHGAQAQGVPGKVPPLAGTLALFMRTPEGRSYLLRVPGAANSALTDQQLAAVFNWLAQRYPATEAAAAAPITAGEVASARRSPLADVQATRRAVVRALAASGAAPPASY